VFVYRSWLADHEGEVRAAVAASLSWAEALRRLGMRPAGGNAQTLKKYVALWGISTNHFDPLAYQRHRTAGRKAVPLEEVLVEGSTYNRGHLKRRLFQTGLKAPVCELCGQDELWNGRRMALILDHINGVADDHRLENLRVVCPNCAATLDTHCGRKHEVGGERNCLRCGRVFEVARPTQRYCSVECGIRSPGPRGIPTPDRRKVERPPYDQLMREIAETNYSAVGRKYGVSDNAVRKWVKWYERQQERERPLAEELQDPAQDPPLAA
jgi:hypothetical protein